MESTVSCLGFKGSLGVRNINSDLRGESSSSRKGPSKRCSPTQATHFRDNLQAKFSPIKEEAHNYSNQLTLLKMWNIGRGYGEASFDCLTMQFFTFHFWSAFCVHLIQRWAICWAVLPGQCLQTWVHGQLNTAHALAIQTDSLFSAAAWATLYPPRQISLKWI